MMRIIAISLCAWSLVACAGGSQVSGDRRVVGAATISFSVSPSRVDVGRPVRFTLRVTNNGGKSEELRFSSGQRYDFWLTRGDTEVWRWSADRAFTQAIEARTLAPQESVSFTETWNATDPGTYVAHGELRADRYERELTGEVIVRD